MDKDLDGSKEEVGKLDEQNAGLIVEDGDEQDGIRIPNWLVEVLAWIKRMEMADSALSTSSWTFNQLSGPKLHGKNVKQHLINRIALYKMEDESGILQALISIDDHRRRLRVPLPNVPPPEYILGFKNINMCYLDARVLEFINCIAPKLNDVHFEMDTATYKMEEWGPKEEVKRTAMVDCLLNTLANKIGHIHMYSSFAKFNQLFPGFIDQLDSLSVISKEEINVDVLYKWLTDRKENGRSKQKLLELAHRKKGNFFERVKQEFTKATDEPVNFLFYFDHFCLRCGEFTLENEKTDEVLISYEKEIREQGSFHLLLRCPKGEMERWKEEGEKKLEANRSEDATCLHVDIDEFGDFKNTA